MISDQPAKSQSEDVLERWSLAGAVALEAGRKHSSSITFGIYGPWGSGKTTFLQFVESHLKAKNSEQPVIWMNGWIGHSWEVYAQILLRAIFVYLKEDYVGWAQRAAQTFNQKLGWLPRKLKVSDATNTVGIEADASSVFDYLSKLAQVDLVEAKGKLKAKCDAAIGTIVVVIDDIDRQESSDIRELFRVLRFFSAIPIVNFVLAIDHSVAATALASHYPEAGLNVLDKFVQVPLYLPPPKSDGLVRLLDDGLGALLSRHKLDFSEAESRLLRSGVYPILLGTLRTPRQVKLTVNLMSMALSLISHEVNLADLLFLTALRISEPLFVEAIRAEKGLLLGEGLRALLLLQQQESPRDKIDARFGKSWESLDGDSAVEVLKLLFPQIRGLYQSSNREQMRYSHNEIPDTGEKRICLEDYFDRYFELDVPSDQLRDIEIENFVSLLVDPSASDDLKVEEYLRFLKVDQYKFFLGLKSRIDKIRGVGASGTLCEMIASSGSLISEQDAKPTLLPGLMSPREAAAELLPELVGNGEISQDNTEYLVQTTQPLEFVFDWYHPARRLASNEGSFHSWFRVAFAARVEQENHEKGDFVLDRYSSHMGRILEFWADGSGESAVKSHVGKCLFLHPSKLLDYIFIFVPQWTSLGDGNRKIPGDLDRPNIDRLFRFVDKGIVIKCAERLAEDSTLLAAPKPKLTALYQVLTALREVPDFVWSGRVGTRHYHISGCPYAVSIKAQNRRTGPPPPKLEPHGCARQSSDRNPLGVARLVLRLAEIKDIAHQDR